MAIQPVHRSLRFDVEDDDDDDDDDKTGTFVSGVNSSLFSLSFLLFLLME
jgi:hypothetical protein